MIRLIFWNIAIFGLIFSLTIAITHRENISKPLIFGALSSYENLKTHPKYDPKLDKVSWLTFRENPTSFINIVPDKNKIKIGCFGDSHTEGIESAPGNDYPSQLQKLLGDRYQVINFGHGGHGFHQIYTLAKHFIPLYDLDYIVLGPRGFYLYRSSSFNNYWNQGALPYSQYEVVDKKLIPLEVHGETSKEKIINYYKLIPSWNLLFRDHVPPSFLKLGHVLYGKHWENPFFSINEEKVREVQRYQIKDLLKFDIPLIHYTDMKSDCRAFSTIEDEHYRLYCQKGFIQHFPFQAEVSHASGIGNYFHAKDIATIIKKNELPEKPKKLFFDTDKNLEKVQLSDALMNKKSHQLGAFLNDKRIACLGLNKGFEGNLGLIKTFSNSIQNNDADSILLGFYVKGQSRASSLFLEISDPQILEKLKQYTFERYRHLNGVFFYQLDQYYIDHGKNMILSEDKNPKDFELKFLFQEEKSVKKTLYRSLYPTHKMIVDYDIKAFELMSKLPSKSLFSFKMTPDCPLK